MDVTFINDTRPSSNRSRRVAVWELPASSSVGCRTFAFSSLEETIFLLSLLPFNPLEDCRGGFKKSYDSIFVNCISFIESVHVTYYYTNIHYLKTTSNQSSPALAAPVSTSFGFFSVFSGLSAAGWAPTSPFLHKDSCLGLQQRKIPPIKYLCRNCTLDNFESKWRRR